ncbi:MAG: hypothetical protein CO150_05280 [Nitrospirae bacterium CG_4_9_14_3_um_filter_53_35]|nr:MAG: hypothetical protein AUK29_04930 [Nitrospirae bacterium CG2_30_53_67]PIS37916.1 MAG: hypothetical protein COT35_03505 [Nitrospirae bacterium CG08_land_8_20_14_0_20_52_24]PIV85468.1 MAG: hypothetical protein COW52_02050 [Nitrospirae bacterium CG17_big_fil_post_rev_8_21_14_2_50_50_9]PIW84129.1 MAG: hypothetical protein COZ95_11415 [Nitrospirae bacterium CG_4_8_14_3_um_filter_50_41]PIX85290.1 MAG: hypothetical protein COZ32_09210 [Nitrospirae bacterium CG_4_10_14_3_um_filter_53_41]PJA7515
MTWEMLTGSTVILISLFLAGRLALHIGQSVIPAYILVGISARPLIGHTHLIHFFAELGVILLLFFIGMEFSMDRFFSSAKRIFRGGIIDLLINFSIGLSIGFLLGWRWLDSLILGGIVYVSSSAIISKMIIDQKRAAYPETETILGILVFEDLVMAVFITMVSAVATTPGTSPVYLLWSLSKGVLFCAAFFLIIRKRKGWIDRLYHVESPELFLFLIMGSIFCVSLFARSLGLTEAIGALFLGMTLSGTPHKPRLEAALIPYRDLLAALFFLSFGLQIKIQEWLGLIPFCLALIGISLTGKLITGYLVGRLDGLTHRGAVNTGLFLVVRGEFSIILAGIATATPENILYLKSVTAIYVLVLSIIGSCLMQNTERVHGMIHRIGKFIPGAIPETKES